MVDDADDVSELLAIKSDTVVGDLDDVEVEARVELDGRRVVVTALPRMGA